MKRREFIIGAATATGLAAFSKGWTQNRNEDKLSRIAVMMFGLNSIVKNNQPASPEKTLDIMDFGELCADRFHVHNVELQSGHFPSIEMSWLKDFRARLNKTKTRVVQMNVDWNAGAITDDSPLARMNLIDLHTAWFDRVVFLGCPRVMINQGQPTQENKEIAVANLKAIVAIAKSKKINVVCAENRVSRPGPARAGAPAVPGRPGGPAAQNAPAAPAVVSQTAGPPSYILLTEIMRAAGAYPCCDFQNFPSESEQHEGIRGMLPYTSGLLHAGMRFDLPKAMTIARELGYKGIYSIKAGGGAETNPLQTTQTILEQILERL